MKVIFLMCVMLMFSSLATSGDSQLEPLRNLICEHETRGIKDPEQFIRSTGELGRCQIKPGTARQVGYTGDNWTLLTDRSVNENVALKVLVMCSLKFNTLDTRRLSFCYKSGLSARFTRQGSGWRYAKQRTIDYALVMMPSTRMELAYD